VSRPDRPIRVLLVDDHESFRSAARLVIAASGDFRLVGEAQSGEEAIAAATPDACDLVLMDIKLPGMDGFEATRRIRAHRGAPRVIVLSTYAADEYAATASAAGADAFITKSEFGPESLRRLWARASRG
jgi:DNA-binding NarL/FixJ family response regulator